MSRSARILRREEVERLRGIDAIWTEAEHRREERLAEAEAERAAIVGEARDRAVRDATQSAMKIIVETETAAQRQMNALEPQMAALVSATVTQIIGDLDQDTAVERATRQALLRLRDHRRARIVAAPDVANAVRAAVEKVGTQGAEIIDVQIDDRLAGGRTLLSSDQGHVEIGLADQIAAVTAAWSRQEEML